ncbi:MULTISPECIES: class I SAM-dependent methyltransferase [unclassified Corallococcus]|uniref:class I SAM-dependent methyltransferase n=1 Tax=unclassified Corallococcus TaxID=2685029 RepID=UPI001CC181B6|nr:MULTISPECIES: class I SAM-dependent methyltransferase [unclassified Corallococcus]MBZ4331483.1 class I SAM-dependent methyltransferase [Corallococcus sp. AS-1-12]MBZ4370150.1 class I SAM-dependent methyltransferase [Corallococcus sp. AS-1-6]
MAERDVPNLTGIPETMLLTLHNRAAEAKRPDGILRDADCVRIYDAIPYDFERSFGKAQAAHAIRAVETDRVLRQWLATHPDGFIVSLGDGLETQALRLDNGRLRWLSVDLPEAMAIRERFLPPTERLRHLPASALDRAWMDAVDASQGVFIVAQGLFMYFEEEQVRRLVIDIAERFPGAELLFDTIPRWTSQMSLAGQHRTRAYRVPPMPWGINLDEVVPTLKGWHPRVAHVSKVPYRFPRGAQRAVLNTFNRLPWFRHRTPGIIHVRLAEAPVPVTA